VNTAVATYGPGLLAVSHGPKEFVHIYRIVECTQAVTTSESLTI
jgi:acetylornithine deacetylase/succinyl-diaminopimelate desuccinylase-like protein